MKATCHRILALEDRRVTAVVPARNEARTIGEIVSRCRAHVDEVLVVDGWSSDGTPEIALRAGAERVIRDSGKGKGAAIRLAAQVVRTGVVVFIDADGSHDPNDIPKLIEPILSGEADHVSGSRLTGGSSELHGGFDEFLRLTGSSFITAAINAFFGVRLSESQNGFRAIRTAVLAALELREDSTTIEQEMIIRTLTLGFRMAEVPTHEHARQHGRSHIHVLRASPRYVWCLISALSRAAGMRVRTRRARTRVEVDLHLPLHPLSQVRERLPQ